MAKFSDLKKIQEEYNLGSDWMKLSEGDNKIRIVSEIAPYGNHFDNRTKKSTICIGKENCLYCQGGDKARVQFLVWIIDRKDQQVKLLRIGYTVFKSISDFAQTEGYEFDVVPDYDMLIKKSGQGLDTEYGVIPLRENKPLTDVELEMIDSKVTNPEEIVEKMKMKLGFNEKIQDDNIPIIEDNADTEDFKRVFGK